MRKIKTGTGPTLYPTRFSSVNYGKPKARQRKSRFWIFVQGSAIWNNFVANKEKELESSPLFKSKVKNELAFF